MRSKLVRDFETIRRSESPPEKVKHREWEIDWNLLIQNTVVYKKKETEYDRLIQNTVVYKKEETVYYIVS